MKIVSHDANGSQFRSKWCNPERRLRYAEAPGYTVTCDKRETEVRTRFRTIITRYLDNFSGYLEIFGGYLEHFLRIPRKIVRPFFEIFVSKPTTNQQSAGNTQPVLERGKKCVRLV